MAKTFVVINFDIEGLHQWEAAKTTLPEVAFLSSLHYHKFKFCVKKKVDNGDNDRNIEIISFEKELKDYFQRNFYQVEIKCCNFSGRSCEVIAQDLMEAYDLDYVQVLEDGYWGAEIHKS